MIRIQMTKRISYKSGHVLERGAVLTAEKLDGRSSFLVPAVTSAGTTFSLSVPATHAKVVAS